MIHPLKPYLSRLRVLAALLATLLTVALRFDASAAADDSAATEHIVARQGPVLERAANAREVRQYWTERRMREASPLRLDRVAPEDGTATQSPSPGAFPRAGRPVYVPADPGGNAPGPFPTRGEVGYASGLDGGMLPRATEVSDTTAFPARTHGKVFLTLGSDDYVCSATVVTTEAEKVVFTAGHCVNDPALGWASNWEFVPGYRKGNAPFGEFAATELWSPKGWTKNKDVKFDLGAAVVGANGSGEKVEDEVGAQGIAFNQSRYQHYTSWGYPAAPPFSGELPYTCESDWVMDDPDPTPGAPPPIGIDCDLAGGSSGGGWVIGDDYLNSVISFGHESYPGIVFGPYFGNTARDLYLAVCECTLDRTPPNTSITAGPSGITTEATPTFRFTSTGTALSFKCKVDGGAYASCSSPKTTAALPDGPHTFSVRATDPAGNTDPTPATRSFVVDTTPPATTPPATTPPAATPPADLSPPRTTITKGAPDQTAKRKVKFRFRSDESGSTFQCKLDKTPWKDCSSPKKVKHLTKGKHKFKVRATDVAGNVDFTPAKDKFRVLD